MTVTTDNIVSALPVMEAFYTIQGEGFHQGKAAYFIRLGGCDVGCFWCDVKASWDAAAHPLLTVKEIIAKAKAESGNQAVIAVVTGGEPLMHDLTELTKALKTAGFQTTIETSGSSPLTGEWDWICVSPKKFKAPLTKVLQEADELKVIIYNKDDFNWAEEHAKNVPTKCKLYLQPEWSRAEIMTPLIVEYIKQNPRWELSLQIHKYINVP
jgi:7-carboxy-7-deazaguanine synthase